MNSAEFAAAVQSIRVMQLKPNDRIVVKIDADLSDETVKRLRENLQREFGGEHKVLVLGRESELSIVREAA